MNAAEARKKRGGSTLLERTMADPARAANNFNEDRVPNRQLTQEEREGLFVPFLADVQARLVELSGGNADLLWALRRKLAKELTYLERSKPQ
jgi:hypothetical protein